MIQVVCPSCQAKLNAKVELAGKTRKCPKCGVAMQIPLRTGASNDEEYATLDDPPAGQHVHDALDHVFTLGDTPDRLGRHNFYVICDRTQIVATWRGDGKGWRLVTTAGMISARRNRDQLPLQGTFVLIELQMHATEQGNRLAGIVIHELAKMRALTSLALGDDEILERITGPGRLSRDQKGLIRLYLRDQFIYDMWREAREVLDYLGNTDYHSPGVPAKAKTPEPPGEAADS